MIYLLNKPKVFIIILNFNSCLETINCIESLSKITYPNYEIIVVDNASSDDSEDEIKAHFTDITVIQSGENLGYAKGNNIGISYALDKGADYICILNNDVVVENGFLEPVVAILENRQDVGMASPCICDFKQRNYIQSMGAYINLYTGLAQAKFKNVLFNKMKDRELEVDYLGGACFVVKRQVFESIGLIPENYFLFFEETEFCLKAARKGYKLICTAKSKVYHKGSLTISKYAGLSYFFINRNRVIFMRRNANTIQKAIFSIYVTIEGIGRMLIRKENIDLFRYYLQGLEADINNIDIEKVKYYIK